MGGLFDLRWVALRRFSEEDRGLAPNPDLFDLRDFLLELEVEDTRKRPLEFLLLDDAAAGETDAKLPDARSAATRNRPFEFLLLDDAAETAACAGATAVEAPRKRPLEFLVLEEEPEPEEPEEEEPEEEEPEPDPEEEEPEPEEEEPEPEEPEPEEPDPEEEELEEEEDEGGGVGVFAFTGAFFLRAVVFLAPFVAFPSLSG